VSDNALRHEIDALRARLAVLEQGQSIVSTPVATLASLGVGGAATPSGQPWGSQDFVTNIIPPPSPTVPLHSLIRSDGLPRDERSFRRCLEAVALGYGVETPRNDIPRDWIVALQRVHAARSGGATWAAALEAAGLEVPTATDLTARQQALRSELYDLYDRVPAMAKWVEKKAPTFAYHNLVILLRQLLM